MNESRTADVRSASGCTRRQFLSAAAGAAAGFALARRTGAGETVPSPAGRRPNIILILTDDQGYGDLGRHGNRFIRTPYLDRFFDEAVRFEDFRVSPTCSPTRAALLTGRHEFRSGVTHTIHERERLGRKATTIAQVLKAAGYATGIFGKWHLGDEAAYQPGRRGFDEVFIHGGGGIGQTYPGSCGDAPGNRYVNPVILHNGVFEKTEGYCTDVFFGQALKWIDARKDAGPFFCYLPTNAPHGPLQVPEKYERLYANLPGGPTGGRPGAAAKFYGMITNIDENVGRLLAALKERGLEENTLVIFMNDNGGTAGVRLHNAGMKDGKGTAGNGGTRAMSLWRWPGTLRPGRVEALTAHLDVFPTLAELAGAKVPEAVAAGLDGFSLVPLLRDPGAAWHDDRMLVTHAGRWNRGAAPVKFGTCSVRWKQWLYFPGPRRGALYDLKADPGERNDVARAQPDVVAKLAQAYDAWWDAVLPDLENETAHQTAPRVNPFKELYWKQYQGPGPNNVPPPP